MIRIPRRVCETISMDETHVYVARIAEVSPGETDLRSSLDASECERADAFRSSVDRTRFVVSHGLLRHVLARYYGEAPARLSFERGTRGKPTTRRTDVRTATPFAWNMSHSRDVVAIAIALALGRPVGIDVEYVDDKPFEAVAAFCFSTNERAALDSLPESARRAAFFATWTRKEAYAKACGFGVDNRFRRFGTVGDSIVGPRIRDDEDRDARALWRIRDLGIALDYAAALVDEVPSRTVRLRDVAASTLGRGLL